VRAEAFQIENRRGDWVTPIFSSFRVCAIIDVHTGPLPDFCPSGESCSARATGIHTSIRRPKSNPLDKSSSSSRSLYIFTGLDYASYGSEPMIHSADECHRPQTPSSCMHFIHALSVHTQPMLRAHQTQTLSGERGIHLRASHSCDEDPWAETKPSAMD
jgi:hypothetical protein